MGTGIQVGKHYLCNGGDTVVILYKIGPICFSGRSVQTGIDYVYDDQGVCLERVVKPGCMNLFQETLPVKDPELLYKISCPRGLVDETYGVGTLSALIESGGPYEIYTTDGWVESSLDVRRASSNSITFRLAKTTLPSIDWSAVGKDFVFLARNSDGSGALFTHSGTEGGEPKRYGSNWGTDGSGIYVSAKAFSSYKPGNCDWKVSLARRPEAG